MAPGDSLAGHPVASVPSVRVYLSLSGQLGPRAVLESGSNLNVQRWDSSGRFWMLPTGAEALPSLGLCRSTLQGA